MQHVRTNVSMVSLILYWIIESKKDYQTYYVCALRESATDMNEEKKGMMKKCRRTREIEKIRGQKRQRRRLSRERGANIRLRESKRARDMFGDLLYFNAQCNPRISRSLPRLINNSMLKVMFSHITVRIHRWRLIKEPHMSE